MVQTSYKFNHDRGKEGGIADAGQRLVLSYAAEGAIGFGRFATLGTDPDKQVKLPSQATDITGKGGIGFAVRQANNEGNVTFADEDTVGVLAEGQIYVKVEENMTPLSDVYIRYAEVAQRSAVTFDAEFVTSNTIDLKINGVAITQVPFNTDSDTTLSDLATQIQANANVATATAVPASNTVNIVAASEAVDIEVTEIVVAGGASQANGTFSVVSDSHPATDAGQVRPDADNTSAAALSKARIIEGATKGNIAVLAIDKN